MQTNHFFPKTALNKGGALYWKEYGILYLFFIEETKLNIEIHSTIFHAGSALT